MKKILLAIAAVVVLCVAADRPTRGCWWDGYGTVCPLVLAQEGPGGGDGGDGSGGGSSDGGGSGGDGSEN